MKNFVLAALVGCGLLAAPVATIAAPVEAPIVMAQIQLRVGPDGLPLRNPNLERNEGRRVQQYDDRYDRRQRVEQPRRFAPAPRMYVRPERCRTYTVRRMTQFGYRTERVRRCR